MNLYNFDDINFLKKKNKKILILTLILFFLGIVVFALSCCFVKHLNKLILQIINGLILSVGISQFIYFLIFVIIPNKKRIEHLEKISVGNRMELTGKLLSISDFGVIKKDLKGLIISIEIQNKEKKSLIFEGRCLDFDIGSYVKVLITNNFIISIIEDKKYEYDN